MNPKIKDTLGSVLVAALVLLALGGLQFTSAYSRSVPPSASFSVSGQGQATAVPDVAEFSFGITTEGGKDIAALQKDNTTKANAALDYVKAQGVDPKDIRTQNYNISPRYESVNCPSIVYSGSVMPTKCPPAQIVGYTINQTITIKVRDFAKIGDIMSGVTERGVNDLSGLSFVVHDRAQVENDARAKAIAEAKSKAQALAAAGHFRLGRILAIQEGNQPYYTYNRALEMSGKGASDAVAAAPSIEPGSEEITQSVTITYEIR